MIDFYCVPTPNGQKIAILLEEIKISYKLIKVQRSIGQKPKKNYLDINPIGKYPAIVDYDKVNGSLAIFETQAIALYLIDKTGYLLPKDHKIRAEAHIWANVISSGITPLMGMQYFLSYRAKSNIKEVNDWVISEIIRYIKPFDKRLEVEEFLAGKELSYADVLAYPIMSKSLLRIPGVLESNKNITRWIKQLSLRESFKKGEELTNK